MADIRTEPSTPDTQSLADYRALDSSVSGQTQSNTGSNEVLSEEAASDLSSSHPSTSTVNDDEGIQMNQFPARKVAKQPPQSQSDVDAIEVDNGEEDPLLSKESEAGANTEAENSFFKKNKNPRFKTEAVNEGGRNAETNFGGTSSTGVAAGSSRVAAAGSSTVAVPSQALSTIAESPDITDTASTSIPTILTPSSTDTAPVTDTSNTSNRGRIVRLIVIAICSFAVAVLALSLCVFFCGRIHGSSNNPSTNELKESSSGTAEVKSNATDHIVNMTDICLDWAMNATINTTGQYNMTNIDWGRCANVTANITTSHSSANLAAANASETTTGSIEADFN